jgi:hypothetical protein
MAVTLVAAVFSSVSVMAQTPDPIRIPELIPPLVSRDLKVTIDTTGAPECQAWAERAREMVLLWHPVVSAYLDAPLKAPTTEIKLVFKDMPGVAATSRDVITIASGWVKSHPEDLGMVLHELVHVVQNYPPSKSGWLVEGIADYIRFWMAEPAGQPKRFNRAKDSYRSGYRITGAFLAWIESKYQVSIVRDANLALRGGTYDDSLFEKKTGKNLDALWAEFIAVAGQDPAAPR